MKRSRTATGTAVAALRVAGISAVLLLSVPALLLIPAEALWVGECQSPAPYWVISVPGTSAGLWVREPSYWGDCDWTQSSVTHNIGERLSVRQ